MIIKRNDGKFDVLLTIAGKQRNVGEFATEALAIEGYKKAYLSVNGQAPSKEPEFFEWQPVTEYKLVKIK